MTKNIASIIVAKIVYKIEVVSPSDDDLLDLAECINEKRSRAHQQQQEVPGSTYPDHEEGAWT
jgi:hypothetical protein